MDLNTSASAATGAPSMMTTTSNFKIVTVNNLRFCEVVPTTSAVSSAGTLGILVA